MCATTVEGIFIFETQAQSHMKGPMPLRKNVAPERFHHLKLQNDKFDGSLTDPQRIEELKLSEVRFHSRITCCAVWRPDHGDRIYCFHAKFMCTNRIWWRKSFQTMPGKYILHVVFLLRCPQGPSQLWDVEIFYHVSGCAPSQPFARSIWLFIFTLKQILLS